MSVLKNIVEGWANSIKDRIGTLDPEIKEVAEKRLAHCQTCTLRNNNTCSVNREGPNVKSLTQRKGCGCNLAAKALAPEAKCPLDKW